MNVPKNGHTEWSKSEEEKHHIICGIQKKEKYKKLHMPYENLLNFTSHIFFFRIHFSSCWSSSFSGSLWLLRFLRYFMPLLWNNSLIGHRILYLTLFYFTILMILFHCFLASAVKYEKVWYQSDSYFLLFYSFPPTDTEIETGKDSKYNTSCRGDGVPLWDHTGNLPRTCLSHYSDGSGIRSHPKPAATSARHSPCSAWAGFFHNVDPH